ncbi:MAG: helix-hairpin-helix domain-containing protein, partial [Tissierellia bacterium]|nr:helix-hairpin-helix domain-containing protein [Tissierellia bacterium]
TAARLLYSFGITNIGLSNAKLISRKFGDDWEKIQGAKYEELIEISGIGEVMAKNYVKFFSDEKKKIIVEDVLKEVEIEAIFKTSSAQIFENYIFVITGSVEHFKNREELKAAIEERGGKVTSSVTSRTNYLINNDNLSNSSKNKKAKELGIEIITEEQFLKMMNTD